MDALEILNCRGKGQCDYSLLFSKMLLQHWATSSVQMSFIILERGKEGSEKRVEKETRRGRSGEEKEGKKLRERCGRKKVG